MNTTKLLAKKVSYLFTNNFTSFIKILKTLFRAYCSVISLIFFSLCLLLFQMLKIEVKNAVLKLETLENTVVNGNKNKNTDIKQVKNVVL